MRWQSHAQHVEQLGRWAGQDGGALIEEQPEQPQQAEEEQLHSKGTTVPTIASQLGGEEEKSSEQPRSTKSSSSGHIRGASGVPVPAFTGEFDEHYMMPTSAAAARKVSDASAASSSASSSHLSHKPSKKTAIAPPSPPSTSSARRSTPSPRANKARSRVASVEQAVAAQPAAGQEKKPLISEEATVPDKVEAFERAAQGSQPALQPSESNEPPAPDSSSSQSLVAAASAIPLISSPSASASLHPSASAASLQGPPSARYADAYPMSIAHASPSQANLHAEHTVPAEPATQAQEGADATADATSASEAEVRPATADVNFELPDDLGADL